MAVAEHRGEAWIFYPRRKQNGWLALNRIVIDACCEAHALERGSDILFEITVKEGQTVRNLLAFGSKGNTAREILLERAVFDVG